MSWSVLMHDPSFWVAVSFVLFVGAFGRLLFRKLAGVLDAHRESVRSELDSAAALHAEAQTLRDRYTDEAAEAEQTSAAILARAEETAAQIAQDSERRLEAHLDRMRVRAAEEVARAEEAVRQTYRERVADLVLRASSRLFQEHVSAEIQRALIQNTVDNMGRALQQRQI